MAVDQKLDHLPHTAIDGKRLIQFKYKCKDRVAEPHDYGIQNGVIRLLCSQVGGKSNGHVPGWRLIDVEGIEGCEMLDRIFEGNRARRISKPVDESPIPQTRPKYGAY